MAIGYEKRIARLERQLKQANEQRNRALEGWAQSIQARKKMQAELRAIKRDIRNLKAFIAEGSKSGKRVTKVTGK